ncbi:hypothetical protein ACJX0J_016493, partial [Zea mays]
EMVHKLIIVWIFRYLVKHGYIFLCSIYYYNARIWHVLAAATNTNILQLTQMVIQMTAHGMTSFSCDWIYCLHNIVDMAFTPKRYNSTHQLIIASTISHYSKYWKNYNEGLIWFIQNIHVFLTNILNGNTMNILSPDITTIDLMGKMEWYMVVEELISITKECYNFWESEYKAM